MKIYVVEDGENRRHFQEEEIAVKFAKQANLRVETIEVICHKPSFEQRYNALLRTVGRFTLTQSQLYKVVQDATKQ